MSLACHGVILAGLLLARGPPTPPAPPEPPAIQVTVVTLPPTPAPAPAPMESAPPAEAPPKAKPPKAAVKPKPAKPPPARMARRTAPPPPRVRMIAVGAAPSSEATGDELSEAQAARAASVSGSGSGSGAGTVSGGGACDMHRRLQAALRRDPQVRAALEGAYHGRPILVWNGGWVRHLDQEGAGLAAVREAVMWEVGFAPAACRAQPMHGVILISLGDGAGSPRVALGDGQWRWSDLLFAR